MFSALSTVSTNVVYNHNDDSSTDARMQKEAMWVDLKTEPHAKSGREDLTPWIANINGFNVQPNRSLLVAIDSTDYHALKAFIYAIHSHRLADILSKNAGELSFEGAARLLELGAAPENLQAKDGSVVDWAQFLVQEVTAHQILQGFPLKARLLRLKHAGCELNDVYSYAIEHKNLAFLKVLLDVGASPLGKDSNQNTILHVVCSQSRNQPLSKLLADVTQQHLEIAEVGHMQLVMR